MTWSYAPRIVERQDGARAAVWPSVVVVVVVHDPDDGRLHAVLRSVAAQDYPNHRVLVVSTGGADVVPAVGRVLPEARVAHVEPGTGFGAAANRAVAVAPGAAYYLLCHDDVLLEPHTLSALVQVAAGRSAGVVGPKLVAWDDPTSLLQVGMSADGLGTPMPLVEPGELDQGQHDGQREVLVMPGAATLVRGDLFERIDGFDEAITSFGDDLSLCWRARLAGAPVLVTSATRVRHAQAGSSALAPGECRELRARHHLRAVLTCYGRLRLATTVPLALLVTVAEALGALARGRAGEARGSLLAWSWNLRRLRSLLWVRRRVRRVRRVPDRAVRRLQVRGIVRPRLRLRRIGGDATRLAAARPPLAEPLPEPVGEGEPVSRSRSGVGLVLLALTAVLAFGSRHLVTGSVPAVGELVPFDGEPRALLAEWASGWRQAGLGGAAAAPTVVGVVGGIGSVLGGQMGLVRTLATLGLVPLGIVGAYRLLRPSGLRWAQVAAAVAYAAVPVPYNALSGGRWSALAVYAGAPFLLGRLAHASGAAPFRAGAGAVEPADHPVGRQVIAVGAVGGLVGLLLPAAPALVALMALALAAGSALAWELRGSLRLLAVGFGGAGVAALLHLPFSLDALRSRAALEAWLGFDRAGADLSASELLRFETGPFGAAPLGFALVAAAAVPVLIGRGWRLAWAVRGWTLAGVCWLLVGLQAQGSLRLPLPHPDVLLALAASGLALAVASGAAAVDLDVGRARRFGLRRQVAALGVLALGASTVPVVAGSVDGWWRSPHGDFTGLLAFVEDDVRAVPSRVLWLGDPEALPGGAGWPWRDGLGYATSLEGGRGVRDLWPGPADGASERIAAALDLAVERRTSRLGRLLAPMSVQYIAVPQRIAPSPFAVDDHPVPPEVLRALDVQLDLQQLTVDPAVAVYRNTAFVPARSLFPADEPLDAASPVELQQLDLVGTALDPAAPVLTELRGLGYRGELPGGTTLLQSWTASDRWRLEVDGQQVETRDAFGWAAAADISDGGEALLSYRPSPWHRVLLGVQALLWLAAGVVALRMRSARGTVGVPPPPPSPPGPPPPPGARSAAPSPPAGPDRIPVLTHVSSVLRLRPSVPLRRTTEAASASGRHGMYR